MKTSFTQVMTALVLMAVVMMGCDPPVEKPTVAMVEDSIVVTHNSAMFCAKVTNNGGAEIEERGFCFKMEDGTPDSALCDGSDAAFSLELKGLQPSTHYACWAFADNEAGRGYSESFSFTTLGEPVPVVKTYFPTEITHNSALAIGCVACDGGQEVMERGICYSLEENPTLEGSHVVSGSGVGQFEYALTGLEANTEYYVRAYAVCTEGVYYGNEKFFWTEILPMEVQTVSVSDVVSTRAKCDGLVLRDGGHDVTERGFCWDVNPHPNIDGLHVKIGSGIDAFSGYISGLQRGVTYYVRAYAINKTGIVYGNDIEFVPDDPFMPWPEGTLPGLFSVSDDRRVRFSKGNLQYHCYQHEWRFAENQWDYVGGEMYSEEPCTMGTVYYDGVKCDNVLAGYSYNGWIDLFGWGTSGWNNGNQYYKPWNYLANEVFNPYYGPVGNHDLTGEYAHADWGVHNNILDGGSRQWRTLTAEEVEYLLDGRTTETGIRYAKAIVAGICGLVLLPDDWNGAAYPFSNPNNGWSSYLSNKISAREWLDLLEPEGAVLLPSVGGRFSAYSYELGLYLTYYSYSPCLTAEELNDCYGEYWTSTQGLGVNTASALIVTNFVAPGINIEQGRSSGKSVRLVTVE